MKPTPENKGPEQPLVSHKMPNIKTLISGAKEAEAVRKIDLAKAKIRRSRK